MARPRSQSLAGRLGRIRLFLCDVDGVLTDCSVYLDGTSETKQFNIQDGFGLRLLQRQGIKVGWISGRASAATGQRARELQVDFLRQGPEDKVAVIEAILSSEGLNWDQVCFMGDDLMDLGAMKRAGVSITVPEAAPEALAQADCQTKARGGHGAVREAVGLILKAQHKWKHLVAEFSA
jgi:3-deoxy-D-manno-octulosonate 8-phosphate phosphatase (KDO 8-P phosphatase)